VDCDAVDARASVFDLAGVQAGANLESERLERVAERACAANRPARAVEGGQNAIAGGPDEVSAVLFDGGAGDDIVAVEQVAPRTVAKRREVFGLPDEVGEEDRG